SRDRHQCVLTGHLGVYSLIAIARQSLAAAKHVRDCAESSGDFLPPSPPAEKATARQDQGGKSCTRDGAGYCNEIRQSDARSGNDGWIKKIADARTERDGIQAGIDQRAVDGHRGVDASIGGFAAAAITARRTELQVYSRCGAYYEQVGLVCVEPNISSTLEPGTEALCRRVCVRGVPRIFWLKLYTGIIREHRAAAAVGFSISRKRKN